MAAHSLCYLFEFISFKEKMRKKSEGSRLKAQGPKVQG
jgi:hypothetical protein